MSQESGGGRAPRRSPALRIGCAGWSLRTGQAVLAPGDGTHLERYARVFDAVEINSSSTARIVRRATRAGRSRYPRDSASR